MQLICLDIQFKSQTKWIKKLWWNIYLSSKQGSAHKISHIMTTHSFIEALRRLMARRGNVRQVRLVNGPSNFVGAKQELIYAFNEMDHRKIQGFLQNNCADWIKWKRNPPAASHMGGILEHQICSARSRLTSLLQTHSYSLDEESLQALMAETEAVINLLPLTTETINERQGCKPLSPKHLLTNRPKVVIPAPVFKDQTYMQNITNGFGWR